MWYGNFAVNATVTIPWSTNSKVGDAVTRTTDGAIRLYKGNAVAQRTSANGITDAEDFDGITGCHMLTIDLSDNTDAGFYTAGSVYHVMLTGAVIDTQTVATWLGSFAIGPLIGNVTEVAGAAVNAAAAQLGVNVVTNSDKTGYALSAASIDAILDEVVEGALTLRQCQRLLIAAAMNKASGGGTNQVTYRDLADALDRIVMTVDVLGNRSAIVLNGA